MKYGYEEGEICGRDGCKGVIAVHPVECCACHINPPCHACTTPREYCQTCGYESKDDERFNGFIVNTDPKTGVHKVWERRKLDETKIDWHSLSHTNASMIKEGVCPKGTTQEEVRKLVDGTFGGRFEYWTGTTFKFIAYTD